MGLKEYRAKRDFERTSEPAGGRRTAARRQFVIQKHDATRLHYDFRLEHDGVLWSWAVPKGPSLDPSEKRLAVEVEDHPVEYATFEGTIPEGEYGGGTVMVWDRGTWQPDGDAAAGHRDGKLTFTLRGKKLQGHWTLVRMQGRRQRGGKPNWLLLKSKDEFARPLSQGDILEDQPLSVKTRRSLDDIESRSRKQWKSNRSPAQTTKTTTGAVRQRKAKTTPRRRRSKSKAKSKKPDPRDAAGVRPARLPERLESQLATLVRSPPAGDEWLHEIKFDGYRMFCVVDGQNVRFVSRNGLDWTSRMPSLVEAVRKLPTKQAVLDGEVVILDRHGVSRFQLLQNAFGDRGDTPRLHYYAFDLLHLDGYDVRRAILDDRKQLLQQLLADAAPDDLVLYSEHVIGSGPEAAKQACRAHLEGIISKRRDAPYSGGRSGAWLKTKCGHEQEFAIGGYTDPGGSRTGFGALLLGYYDAKHRFTYAGRVGTGFNDRLLRELSTQLRRLEVSQSPFEANGELARGRNVHWVRPKLVGQIKFADWTQEGLLRQPSFQGLRDDKPAADIRRETPRRRGK